MTPSVVVQSCLDAHTYPRDPFAREMDPATGNLTFWTCNALAWKSTEHKSKQKDEWVIDSCLQAWGCWSYKLEQAERQDVEISMDARCWRRISHLSRESKDNVSIFYGQVVMNLYHLF